MEKILKRLHLLDYLVILIILFGILAYFLLFKRQSKEILVDVFTPASTWSPSAIQPQLYWQTQSLNPGLQMYNSLGKPIAKVINVVRVPWDHGSQEYVYMTLAIKAFYNNSTKIYTFNSKPLLIGNDLQIEAGKTLLKAQVIGIYKNELDRSTSRKTKKATVKVKFAVQDPWIAEKFKDFEIKDNNQRTILKTIKAEVVPSETVQPNWQGQLVRTINPAKVDVNAVYELDNIICSETNCYFNTFFPLSVGRSFPVDFVTVAINPDSKIMDIVYHD